MKDISKDRLADDFSDRYWKQQYEFDKTSNSKWFVYKNHHYIIGKSDPDTPKYMKGFGGDTITIQYDNGEVITTDNLWGQGEIPEKHRNLFNENHAKIIKWNDTVINNE